MEQASPEVTPSSGRRAIYWLIGAVGVVVLLTFAAVAGGVGWYLGSTASSSPAVEMIDEPDSGEATAAERTRTDPLFLPPEDLGGLIADVKDISVTVSCADGSGTGWVIDTQATPIIRPSVRKDYGPEYQTTVVTAEHVISDCRKDGRQVRVRIGETSMPAVLMSWDKDRDVATVGIEMPREGARPFTFTPDGSWAMTVGAPLDDVLVPTIGQVVHDDGYDLYLHLTSRPGNSGGPVVNARGDVIGTIGGTILDEETDAPVGWSYAAPVEALCEKLFTCSSMGIDAHQAGVLSWPQRSMAVT